MGKRKLCWCKPRLLNRNQMNSKIIKGLFSQTFTINMGKIFISHSQKDNESINLFNTVFAASKVEAIYEEIHALLGFYISSDKIKSDIQSSSAFFLLHDNLIESLPHTRDWITSECGIANGLNKDIWVFEKYNQVHINELVVPQLDHLVVYDPKNLKWLEYISKIINKYIPTNDVAVPLAATALGAAVSENGIIGGTIGAIVGLGLQSMLNSNNSTNLGEYFQCQRCLSTYSIHVPIGLQFRCPVCSIKYEKI